MPLPLTPRWVALTLAAILGAGVCVAAGIWQWNRTQSILAAERAALEEPIAVEGVAPESGDLPAESTGRRVDAFGTFEPGAVLYVSNRGLDGATGFWIVSPLRLADGSRIAVLRGWSAEASASLAPAPVLVRGVLSPEERFYSGGAVARNGDTVPAMSREAFVSAWGEPLRTGIVVLAGQEPSGVDQPRPVPPTVQVDVAFPLQNFFYAFQWWVFAAFVVFMWGRWLRLDIRASRSDATMSGEAAVHRGAAEREGL
jgi:cytochrome oxidase assembly protein ShyY1